MNAPDARSVSSTILKKAIQLGASLAGFANVEDLKTAPSFTFAPQMPGAGQGVGTREGKMELAPGEVQWPDNGKTVLTIAVEHPTDKPEMDWWHGLVSPSGNKILVKIIKELCEWIPQRFGIGVFHFPYHVEKGGIYLKDAAAMAGLGCIGRNNLLVTPRFGPRVRLRAMVLDVQLPSTGPIGFDPCLLCDQLCRRACPQKAFDRQIYSPEEYGDVVLPAREGVYSRPTCNMQMEKNIANAEKKQAKASGNPVKVIKYCRNCELSCPVGK